MTRSTLSRKALVLAVSTAAFASAAYLIYPYLERESETVRLVDTTEALQRATQDRFDSAQASDSTAAEGDYPPPLVREELSEETAKLFFPGIGTNESCNYDPHEFTRRAPHFDKWFKFAEHPDGGWHLRTNALGMRNDGEVSETRPDLRVLVTGDSHVEGVCANHESATYVLDELLSASNPGRNVEVLNAGAGAHNPFNYLGTFERFADLQPDLYVVVVYGGNDFSASMLLDRYFRRRPAFKTRPHMFEQQDLPEAAGSLLPQELSQDVYFSNNPDDLPLAVDLTCAFSVELQALCDDQGTDLLFVYLPPPTRAQPEYFQEELDGLMQYARMEPKWLGSSDRVADDWLAFLDGRGLEYIDLRDAFRASDVCLYWRTDHHLNVAGHALLGRAIFDRLAERYAR
jgi:GDSL-like Lipase/Acylhydrolase family